MSTNASLSDLHKAPSSIDTWVALGDSSVRFNSIAVSGQKSDSSYNAGDLFVRVKNGVGSYTVSPGFTYALDAPDGTYLNASQIEVKIETAGDGAFAQYTAATLYSGS